MRGMARRRGDSLVRVKVRTPFSFDFGRHADLSRRV